MIKYTLGLMLDLAVEFYDATGFVGDSVDWPKQSWRHSWRRLAEVTRLKIVGGAGIVVGLDLHRVVVYFHLGIYIFKPNFLQPTYRTYIDRTSIHWRFWSTFIQLHCVSS